MSNACAPDGHFFFHTFLSLGTKDLKLVQGISCGIISFFASKPLKVLISYYIIKKMHITYQRNIKYK